MNLKEILEKHKLWIFGKYGGERADLCDADLTGADLRGADLNGARLNGADLNGADLTYADLNGAQLTGAQLNGAQLIGADLNGARLNGADLNGADLCDADLTGADLRGADLNGAQLTGARGADKIMWNIYTTFYPLQCPETGAYVGYKKARGLIVELEITADALRSSATSRKCRASKARVLSIADVDGNPAGEQVESDYDKNFVYIVGETVEVPNFDVNRWKECAPGIHHFITREEAVKYE